MPRWHEAEKGLCMKNSTMKNLSIFIKFLPVYKKIGSSCVSKTELRKLLKELMTETVADEEFLSIDPFIKENERHELQIDMCLLRNDLKDFLKEFLPGLLSEEVIREYVLQNLNGKVLYDISDVENAEKQSYKYLYQVLMEKHEELRESFYDQKYSLDNAHRDLAKLNAELKHIKANTGKMKNTTADITTFITDFLTKDIIVQKVMVVDAKGKEIVCINGSKEKKEPALSDTPGIYSGKRPSWFTPLREELELSKKNVSKKTAEHTKHFFSERLQFWRGLKKKKISVEKKADCVNEARKRNIEKLLLSNDCNEEKYIKYMLLTPGMDKEYMKTLNGAAELGLDANVVIELLEQPAMNFNREMFEAYVSQVHKATEYNLKQELAEELIRGEWYVMSEINGIRQKYQLVPMERISEVEKRLQHICNVFEEFEKISSDTSCHDGTKSNAMEFVDESISSTKEYSDSVLFDEPSFFEEPHDEHEPEEMEILFVKQVENEYMKSSEEL